MELLVALFSFEGRLSRIGYWRSQVLVALLFAVIWVGAMFATLAWPVGPYFALPLLVIPVAGFSMAARRLHDRGKSAWWLVLFIGAPAALVTAADHLLTKDDAAAVAALGLALAALAIGLWAMVEISFLRGSRGPNRFGPEPQPTRRRPAVLAA